MTNLDELEELLRRGRKEEAYEQIKEDRSISAELLMNEGITFGTIGEYDISISYFELAEKLAEDDKIKEELGENFAVAYYNQGLAYFAMSLPEYPPLSIWHLMRKSKTLVLLILIGISMRLKSKHDF